MESSHCFRPNFHFAPSTIVLQNIKCYFFKFGHIIRYKLSKMQIFCFAYKHFVTCRINLIHYMLNKFKKELKELFFWYFFTEISQSCFSSIFVKVYMASLKWHKKTSLVTLLSFSQQHWSESKKHTFISNLHNCQFILRMAVNFIYSNIEVI